MEMPGKTLTLGNCIILLIDNTPCRECVYVHVVDDAEHDAEHHVNDPENYRQFHLVRVEEYDFIDGDLQSVIKIYCRYHRFGGGGGGGGGIFGLLFQSVASFVRIVHDNGISRR